jgi:hypothetical protein
MTPNRFDSASRALATAGTRRAAFAGFVAALAALVSGVSFNALGFKDPRKRREDKRAAGGRKRDRQKRNERDKQSKNKDKDKKKKSGSKGCKVKHSEKEVLDFIAKAAKKYGQSNSAMVRVARCESGLDPCAFNKSGPYYGLFQFLKSTWKTTPYKNDSIHDPKAQALATAWMWKQGRKNEWACK